MEFVSALTSAKFGVLFWSWRWYAMPYIERVRTRKFYTLLCNWKIKIGPILAHVFSNFIIKPMKQIVCEMVRPLLKNAMLKIESAIVKKPGPLAKLVRDGVGCRLESSPSGGAFYLLLWDTNSDRIYCGHYLILTIISTKFNLCGHLLIVCFSSRRTTRLHL